MNAGLQTTPSATTLELADLVEQAWSGQIRVPHFQRSFRWGRTDVLRLFDSIAKHYPVGSLLLWRRPAKRQELQLGALQIDAPETDSALWVVDGQQRIVSLANALNPAVDDQRFSLGYDLREGHFVRLTFDSAPEVVPLPVLFDLKRILTWFTENPGMDDYQDRAFDLTRTLRQFRIPAYLVAEDDVEVLQDIFDRMNNYGKRLRRSEVFSALHAGVEGAEPESLTFDLIAEHVDSAMRFGVIDNDTILKAVLSRRGTDVLRDIRNEFKDSGDEGRDAAYAAGEQALLRAVTFLQTEVGVPHFSLLAYRYLLVVLTRVFALFPEPDARNRQLLRRWYWRAAIAGPEQFKGSTSGAIRALCAKVRQADLSGSVQDLLSAVDIPVPLMPDLRRFRSNEAATKIILCSWWARGPRSLTTGERFQVEDLADVVADQPTAGQAIHYIWPRHDVRTNLRLWAANRILMPDERFEAAEMFLWIIRTGTLGPDAKALAQESHAITQEMATMLSQGRVTEFVQQRQELLQSGLRSFLEVNCEWGFEDTPPLAELIIDDEDEDDEGASGDFTLF